MRENPFDRAIRYFAPVWAAERVAARFALQDIERLATHRDAIPSPLDPAVLAPGVNADWTQELGRDRRTLVDRARQAVRDNPICRAVLKTTVDNVVGTGFKYRAMTGSAAWNLKAEALVKKRSEAKNCDVREIHSLQEGTKLGFRGYLRDGESATIKVAAEDHGRLRFVESDEIGEPAGYWRPDRVDGIELDAKGRPKFFHVFKPSMKVIWSDRRISGERERIRVADVNYVANRERTGATRGITFFDGVFGPADQLFQCILAKSVQIRMGASIGLVINKNTPFTTPEQSLGSNTRALGIFPGKSLTLKTGESATQIATPNDAGSFEGHVRLLARLVGTPFGSPIEVMLNDFSQSNYSNARIIMLQCWKIWRGFQHLVATEMLDPVIYWWLLEWMESGELEVRDDFEAHRWSKPGWQWIDVVAEIEAMSCALDLGIESRTSICARMGVDFLEMLEEIVAERKAMKEAGVDLVYSTLTRDKTAAPAPKGADGRRRNEGNKAQDIRQVKNLMRKQVEKALRNSA